jgi:predicted phosphate transport protein (TIGR00153 family)
MPPDMGFYDLFNQAADNVAEAARLLRDMLADNEAPGAKKKLRACEQRGDELTDAISRRLTKTIVPPFDPEDIHTLSDHLDDAVDDIDSAGELLFLHQVTRPLPEMLELADLLIKTADANIALIAKLPQMRGLGPELEAIDRLESEADKVYRRSVARLFSGELNAFEVIKLKDVVEVIEASVNKIEKISDTVEAIAVKHS